MKKIVFVAAFILAGTFAAKAQSGRKAVGLNLNFATESSIGLGARFQYNLTKDLRIEPSVDYYFKSDHQSMFDVNVNVHYLFNVWDKLQVYPLAGLSYERWNYDGATIDYGAGSVSYGDGHSNRIAANLGAGAEYPITSELSALTELKFQLTNDYTQFIWAIGVAYKF